MIELVNIYTGTSMWVAEDRLEEYKAAGHKLAALPIEPAKEPVAQPEKKLVKKSSKSKR